MSLFDIFNTSAQDSASSDIKNAVQSGYGMALPQYQAGLGAVQTGVNAIKNGGIGSVQQGIGTLKRGAVPAVQQGIGTAGQSAPFLQSAYSAGAAPNWQTFGTGMAGTTAYGNALGVNGPAGNAAALAAFQNNPGYQFQKAQGDEALLRQSAATGGTGSGGEAAALSNYNQNLANTSWNNYVGNLQPYLGMAQGSAGALGSLYGNLGNAGSNALQNVGLTGGQQLAGAYGGIAGLQGNQLAGQYGTIAGLNANQMNQGFQNIGNMYYGGQATIGNAQANADLAGLNASANLWGLGTGLLGGALGSGLKLSDIQLKENIEPVGKLADGMNVYRYNYKGDPTPQIGLLAQEVEQVAPEAVVEFLPNLRAVDYRRATERAAKIMEFDRHRGERAPTHRPFGNELLELAA